MPGESGAAHTQEMLFLFSVRFTSKPCGSGGGGKQTRSFGLFLPAFFFPCCSITFESDDERESNCGVDGVEREHK